MAEARRLLAANPGLARCGAASFGSLNSPLHLAAAKGHHEMAALLLENGADVNARNMYGQTALMQACRFGHWEVVQMLLVFRCNVWKVGVRLLLAAAGGGGDSDRWLPADVARTWGCHWLEHVLSPKSHLPVPKLPPSGYLSSPLASVIDLARECGLQLLSSSSSPSEYPDSGDDACAVCLERPCDVAAEVCGHELCVKCALDLCSVIQSYDAPAGRDRRLHPVPALPRRHRLVQETGSF